MYKWTLQFGIDYFIAPKRVSKDCDYYPALKETYNQIYAILVENNVPSDIQDTKCNAITRGIRLKFVKAE